MLCEGDVVHDPQHENSIIFSLSISIYLSLDKLRLEITEDAGGFFNGFFSCVVSFF